MKIFTRTLIAGVALAAIGTPAFASAQTADFSVPSEPISDAVRKIGRQAGVQIIVSGDAARGRTSNAVNGSMDVEQALASLLAGTGLEARKTGDRTYVVVRSQSGVASNGQAASPTVYADPIVVTAQRRQEDLQDVPVAVTAIRGEDIDRRGTNDLFEVARTVPGLTVSQFSEAEPIIAVRGAFNTFSQAGASKPVGVFIDDVFISRNSASTFQLFDLESIEVLRGPQGTLFGRNVTGGAIVVSTAKPRLSDTQIKGEASYGNFNALTLRGLVSGPIAENAGVKLSANYITRDGFSTDRLINREIDDFEGFSLRGAVLVEPSDTVSVLLAADYDNENSNGRGLSATSPAAADDGDIRTIEAGVPQSYDREGFGLSATINVETGVGDVTSITAYRESQADETLAFSPVNFSFLPMFNPVFPFQRTTENRDNPRSFSQELRLISDPGSRLGYVAGLYYFRESIERDARTLQFTGMSGTLNRDRTFLQDVTTQSYAAYLNLSYEFADYLKLHLGGRYTFEEKEVNVDYVDALNPAGNFTDVQFKDDYDQFTPRVAIEVTPSDDVLLYASYTQGFTAGGFNTEEPSIAVVTAPFDPETVDAFEIGMKTSLFDDRLTFNIAGFIQDYKDKQEGFLTPDFNFVIQNASSATVQGIEVETRFAITRTVSLSASYAYLDAKYDEFLLDLNNEDRSGNFLPTSPEHAFSISFDGDFPITDNLNLIANAEYSWQEYYFSGSDNRPSFLIDSYDLANASIGLEDADGRWRVVFFADNIFDEEYVLIRSDFGASGVGEAYGAPATYGVRVGFDF
ncbi:TonB-dependent receptor domain-containing protein [Qipengyuania qiaonensis]|uniref:TonB-dependent receptor n=1 Tax=Qipengyuania qiaonensis TaxID=2867240 RepID=A0ABS7J9Z0_9SPHN|nr:TonB-dependent receptor [Qipengyuania qiaonensis]MBX7484130.1 TonB-dependent receptor [Qipengyuania qiaonensis]